MEVLKDLKRWHDLEFNENACYKQQMKTNGMRSNKFTANEIRHEVKTITRIVLIKKLVSAR